MKARESTPCPFGPIPSSILQNMVHLILTLTCQALRLYPSKLALSDGTRATLIDRTLMLTFDVPAILSDPLPPCHVPSHSLKILKTLYRTPYEPTLSAGVFENRCLLSTGRHGSPDIAPCAWMHDPFVAYMRTVCLYSCVQHQIVVLMAVRVLQGRPLESSSTDRHRFR